MKAADIQTGYRPAGEGQRVGQTHLTSVRFVQVFTIALCAFLIIARRPQSLFAPGLWAEDGPTFLAPQLIDGAWKVIFQPYAGYLQIFPRLVTVAVCHLPTISIPFDYALVSIAVSVAACTLFASDRYRSYISSDVFRGVACVAIVCVVPMSEIFGNITNVHWYLSLTGLLLLAAMPVASERSTVMVTWRDMSILVLAALSSAECLLLVPLALWRAMRAKGLYRVVPIVFVIAAFVQFGFLLRNVTPSHQNLVTLTVATINGYIYRIVLAALVGNSISESVSSAGHAFVRGAVAVGGTIILLATLGRIAGPGVRRFIVLIVLGVLFIASALGGRDLTDGFRLFGRITLPIGDGGRYFVLPMILFMVASGVALSNWMKASRPVQILVFVLMFAVGACFNFRMERLAPSAWSSYAAAIETWRGAQRNKSPSPAVTVPINPPGWQLVLPALH